VKLNLGLHQRSAGTIRRGSCRPAFPDCRRVYRATREKTPALAPVRLAVLPVWLMQTTPAHGSVNSIDQSGLAGL
jgi:hypothetical protein